jgi:hypothetical protein
MLRKLRPRSAYDVMAAIALFVALGGTAYAVNTIGSSDVIDESLLSQDIKNGEVKNSELGTNSVTSSRIATGNVFTSDLAANSVDGSKVIANSLTGGDIGPNAVATSELTDGSVTKPKLAAPEAWQNVKPPDDSHCNSPDSGGYFFCYNDLGAVSSYWGNDADTSNNNAAYYKDPYGVVHLKGSVCETRSGCANSAVSSNETMLYLPPGYQPAKDWRFHTEGSFGDALVVVRSGFQGNVDVAHGNHAGVSLDGIEFRACGEPGSEACQSGGSS